MAPKPVEPTWWERLVSRLERRFSKDTTPPGAPGNLQGSYSPITSIATLTWTAASDNRAVKAYKIFRNGNPIGFATGTSYQDVQPPAALQTYAVQAFDAAGNLSAAATVQVNTSPVDTTAPTTPTLTATAVSSSAINLSWTEATDDVGIASYVLERATNSGFTAGLTTVYTGLARTFSDTGLASSTPYYYRVHARDAATNQSGYGTANATTQAASSSSGFYDDAYSTYTTWYVDGTNGTDTATPDTDRRAAGYVYRTIQNALNDVFYLGNGGSRRIIVRQGTYASTDLRGTYSTPTYYVPGGGAGENARCVLMGDPALSPANMPVLQGSVFSIGKTHYTGTNTYNNYLTFRKLKMASLNSSAFTFNVGDGGDGRYMTLEYLNIDTITDASNGASGETALVYWPGYSIRSANCTIRYCKIAHVYAPSGNQNACGIGSYGADDVTIENCLFEDMRQVIRWKTGGGGMQQNRWRIRNNIFKNTEQAVFQHTQGGAPIATDDVIVENNLVYGNGSTFSTTSGLLATNTISFADRAANPFIVRNNTIGPGAAMYGIALAAQTDARVYDNLDFGSGSSFGGRTSSVRSSVYPNSLCSYTVYDYNAYFAGPFTLDYGAGDPYGPKYKWLTVDQWKLAYTNPRDLNGNPTTATIAEFLTMPGDKNPDAHAVNIPNLVAPYNTVAGNCPGYASGDFTLAAGSPLNTAGSTGGRIGCNMATVGPGW